MSKGHARSTDHFPELVLNGFVTRLGHTLNDMLAVLEEAVERERHFVNDASHELRTPLTLLKSRIQLARRRARSVEEHERILDELSIDVGRLAALAEDLLALGSGPSTQQAASEKHKVKLSVQEVASTPDAFHRLPARLRDLVAQSMRLQARVIHLDQLLYARKDAFAPQDMRSPVADQLARLQAAFAS